MKEISWGILALVSFILGIAIPTGWGYIVSLATTGGYSVGSGLATAIVDLLGLYFFAQGGLAAYKYKESEKVR